MTDTSTPNLDSTAEETRILAALPIARKMCREAIGYVQAGQSEALYEILCDLARVLDGTLTVIERCERCSDPVEDHIDAESSCAIWARGADGEVLTVD